MASRARDKRTWAAVREHALGLPGAWEDFPWDEVVAKVAKKVFVFLGRDDGNDLGMTVKLTDSHPWAMATDGAAPAGYGLGKAGWVTVRFAAVDRDALVEWVDESYRNVAPKKLIRELDEIRTKGT
jgi:predicted DNA-binding protein (MmcQ/YjbR family)